MKTQHIDNSPIVNASLSTRRDFLKGGGALTLASARPGPAAACADKGAGRQRPRSQPNAFRAHRRDSTVTVISPQHRDGPGHVHRPCDAGRRGTGCRLGQVSVEAAPADAKRYANPAFGGAAGHGRQHRHRELLGADPPGRRHRARHAGRGGRQATGTCRRERSRSAGVVVSHAGKKQDRDLRRTGRPPPRSCPCRRRSSSRTQGLRATSARTRRASMRVAKSTGTATFTQDVKLPGMLTAVVLYPPRFGAQGQERRCRRGQGDAGCRQRRAVQDAGGEGVAVLAKDFWSAKKGRDALKVEWDETNAFKQGSAEIMARVQALAQKPGARGQQ